MYTHTYIFPIILMGQNMLKSIPTKDSQMIVTEKDIS